MSLGYVVVPLWSGNNPANMARLLEDLTPCFMFVSHDSVMQTLANEANKLLVEKNLDEIPTLPMIQFADLDSVDPGSILEDGVVDIGDTDVAIIVYSSGKLSMVVGFINSTQRLC